MNKYDVYKWIIKVIKSCKTNIQLMACTKLIYNFHNMYDDEELYRNLLTFKLEFNL